MTNSYPNQIVLDIIVTRIKNDYIENCEMNNSQIIQ